MQKNLNKTAIVTGGSRGIGLAIVQGLISQGAKIVICSRTKSELEKALKNLNSKDLVAFGLICDISKISDCKKLITFAQKKLGRIDILINNAGIYGPVGPLEKIDLKDFEKTIKVNLLGAVYCSALVIPLMEENRGGRIINICGAGVGGLQSLPRFAAYFTSKSAIASFSEVLAEECGDKNIQVNAVSPGAVNTYFNDYLIKVGKEKAGKKMYEAALKLKKEGGFSSTLVAKLIVFLCSKDSDHITGRLISAKWDHYEDLKNKKLSNNLYRLRRIDQNFFYEKE